MAEVMGSLGEWLGCASGPPPPSSGTAPEETGQEGVGRKPWRRGCESACVEAEGGVRRLTLPSPEDDAILCRCSCSEGSEAYWASSYSTLVRGGLVMSR